MKKNEHTLPEYWNASFSCPHCNVLATQKWVGGTSYISDLLKHKDRFIRIYIDKLPKEQLEAIEKFVNKIRFDYSVEASNNSHYSAECSNCHDVSIWIDKKMVYPPVSTSPPAHKDMPESVEKIYEEARNVALPSPRSAAVLLRVALEELTKELDETEGSLYQRIRGLENQGLSKETIEYFDTVRIITNEIGAHAGVLDLNKEADPEIINDLFFLVNTIVEQTSRHTKVTEKTRKLKNKINKLKRETK